MQIKFNTREELVNLINEKNYKIGAEIGVRGGDYSNLILKNSNISEWYCIDIWEQYTDMSFEERCDIDTKNNCIRLLEKYIKSERCKIVQKYSVLASQDFSDEYFDFVYIDASHSYKHVVEDISAWWKKVKIGGCLAGHDYCSDAWPGVVQAVDEFVQSNKLELFGTNIYGNDESRKSWFVYKS